MALHLFARNLPPVFAAPDSDGVCPRLVQRIPAWGRTARRRVYARLTRFAILARALYVSQASGGSRQRGQRLKSGPGAGRSDGALQNFDTHETGILSFPE